METGEEGRREGRREIEISGSKLTHLPTHPQGIPNCSNTFLFSRSYQSLSVQSLSKRLQAGKETGKDSYGLADHLNKLETCRVY